MGFPMCTKCMGPVYGFHVHFSLVTPAFTLCEPCWSEILLGQRRPYSEETIRAHEGWAKRKQNPWWKRFAQWVGAEGA